MKMFQLRLSLEETISMSVIGFAGSKQLFTRHLKFKPHSSFKIKKNNSFLSNFSFAIIRCFVFYVHTRRMINLSACMFIVILDDNTLLHVLWFWEADLIPMLIFCLCELIILSSVCFTLNKLLTNSCYPRLADLLLYIL